MFTRTEKRDIPAREDMDIEHAMCPPHDFEAAWALAPDAVNGEDTMPALYCKACGDVRAFRLPS